MCLVNFVHRLAHDAVARLARDAQMSKMALSRATSATSDQSEKSNARKLARCDSKPRSDH